MSISTIWAGILYLDYGYFFIDDMPYKKTG